MRNNFFDANENTVNEMTSNLCGDSDVFVTKLATLHEATSAVHIPFETTAMRMSCLSSILLDFEEEECDRVDVCWW